MRGRMDQVGQQPDSASSGASFLGWVGRSVAFNDHRWLSRHDHYSAVAVKLQERAMIVPKRHKAKLILIDRLRWGKRWAITARHRYRSDERGLIVPVTKRFLYPLFYRNIMYGLLFYRRFYLNNQNLSGQ